MPCQSHKPGDECEDVCARSCYARKYSMSADDPEPDPLGYATRLAESMWRKHYQKEAPNWRPFDDIVGVLTQIDNMVTGLMKKPASAAPALEERATDGVKEGANG
jgi:hypothetical protein